MLDVLFIGGATQAEFRKARTILSETARVVDVPDARAASEVMRTADPTPSLAVVAVTHPGQFRNAEIELLCREAPLLKVVALLGTWCEGETRTGHPWPADDRVFWYHWPMWWQRQLHALDQGKRPSWDMPRTATEQDRSLTENSNFCAKRAGLIAVAVGDHATFATLADALSAFGYSAAWFCQDRRPVSLSNVSGGIWDGGQLEKSEFAPLASFCARLAPAPVVVLLDFPRIEAVTRAKSLGVAAVLGKPYSIDDLTNPFLTFFP